MQREQVSDVVQRGIHELGEALAAGRSERLRAYLAVMARFPSYSFNNQILIYLQAPDATRVQGFQSWKKLGRKVKKGEKGIGIIAPMVYRKDKDASPESDEKTIRGFKVVHVFDVSQTEGDPLPEFAPWNAGSRRAPAPGPASPSTAPPAPGPGWRGGTT